MHNGHVTAGAGAAVRVPVATLWTDPREVRELDAPALEPGPDMRAWVAGMTPDDQVGDAVLSQLLLGEQVLVQEVRADGWARVVAVEQPAPSLDPRGYPGWVPAAQLSPQDEKRSGRTLVVDAAVTSLHAAPGGPVVLTDVVLSTWLTAVGDEQDGWQPVHVPGHAAPLWVSAADVVDLPTHRPSADELLEVGRRLRDARYVWGGVTAFGIDCSGLVRLSWRRFGVLLPRDADDQAATLTDVPLGQEQPGDLYCFARPGRPVHHIGIVTATPDTDRHMLHACYTRRHVVEEPMPEDRVATLVSVKRV